VKEPKAEVKESRSRREPDSDMIESLSRREPEEEFFMLSVLALKMIHTEEYQDNDYVYEISS
jgi:hypothetical protein